jgi:antitoxin PrlF
LSAHTFLLTVRRKEKGSLKAIRSKLTAKGQTTIPRAVRQALRLREGDLIEFEVEDGAARLRKVEAEDLAYLRLVEEGLAEEWLSPEDHEAYDDL